MEEDNGFKSDVELIRYVKETNFKFVNVLGNRWKYAIPFTDEELDNFKIGYKGE